MNSLQNASHVLGALRYGSVAIISIALFFGTWAMTADLTGMAYRYWSRYCTFLEVKMRARFIFTPGRHIAIGQLLAMFAILVGHFAIELPFWWLLMLAAIYGPTAYLESERKKYVTKLEDQLDNFLLALANALKATPSIGAALGGLVAVVEEPIKLELELALKEMKLGSPLDQALLHMASRVGSRQLDSAFSAILIGRQVGGNLPKVLETTATTLREMKRLEGLIRTKTADSRMQLWVVGAMPVVFIVGFGVMWPGYFDPLMKSVSGYIIIGVVVVSWISGLILTRKVLAVDI